MYYIVNLITLGSSIAKKYTETDRSERFLKIYFKRIFHFILRRLNMVYGDP